METQINFTLQKINNKLIPTINTKELYLELGLEPSHYSRWIKTNLLNNPFFVEEQDFTGVRHCGEGFDTIIYFANFDTAKHLCMLSRTKKAHDIRQYFIEAEKDYSLNNKNRHKHMSRKYLTEQRKIQVMNRLNMTDKIQDIYGKDAPFYIYTNYTKLVYKKVFGLSKVTDIKKKFQMSDKETIRDSQKIPEEKKDQITELEYDVHCLLQVLKLQKLSKEECYEKVKNFLFRDQKLLDK